MLTIKRRTLSLVPKKSLVISIIIEVLNYINKGIGKTGEDGTHSVKVLFKGGWPAPPTPVFIDANVTVLDLNNVPLHVRAFIYFYIT